MDLPNSISKIGFLLQHDRPISKSISTADAPGSMDRLIHSKVQTYQYQLAPYSIKEKSIMTYIARSGFVR